MDKSIITRELQILLEAINEQYEIIKEYENFIPQIEFDMIMENVRKLYETFHRLQRLNDPLLFVEKKLAGPKEIRKPSPLPESGTEPLRKLVPEPVPESLREPVPEILHELVPESLREPVPEILSEPFPEPPVPPKPFVSADTSTPVKESRPIIPLKPPVKREPEVKPKPVTGELELFAAEEPVFNIRLKEAREKSLGPKLSGHESFKASIGINDKFMFINELFDGNLREYNESIETLGGFKTLPQAQEYLDLLRRRYNWNSSLPAFRKIKEKVENRF
ncbi:MAG: hypothetical protein WCO02_09835 [Bacteroidota bacterium]